MNLKWVGVVLIISGCGSFGFSMAADHRKKEQMLHQLISALNRMEWELTYRLTSLPELCRQASEGLDDPLGTVFNHLAEELEMRRTPDAAVSMEKAMEWEKRLPDPICQILKELGATMGQFDLSGQVLGFQSVRNACQRELERMEDNKEPRLRCYQALGLCTGVALAIILL